MKTHAGLISYKTYLGYFFYTLGLGNHHGLYTVEPHAHYKYMRETYMTKGFTKYPHIQGKYSFYTHMKQRRAVSSSVKNHDAHFRNSLYV